jgi:type II secretory pathway component PulJ
MTVCAALMALLAVIMARVWYGVVRPTANLAARARINEEATLAVDALARDLGGYLSDTDGRTGSSSIYRFVGRMQPDNSQLWLCFDGGDSPNGDADWDDPDIVIIYQLQGSSLVRHNQTTGTDFIVARYVDSLQLLDLGDRVQIQLTFLYRGISQTYTFVARDP